jgi:dTDP-4-amino-4,6-dideoxygalactose transaminase
MPLFSQKIYFGNPAAQFESHRAEILAAIEQICAGGMHILGPAVEKFEQEFAAWNGMKHAVGVASGTDALTLTLKAFDIGPGDEVITVSHTALATGSAIIAAGAVPVLVDVNSDTFTLDPANLQAALSKKARAIIPVHLYGYPCDMDAILAFAKANNLVVIEDCAQAHGAKYKDRKVGTMGDAGTFSFYPTKNLGAVGDGGAVITNDTEIAANIKKIRQYGWDDARVGMRLGAVSRLDALQAAILSVKLKYLDEDTKRRQQVAKAYDAAIDWKKFGRPQALKDSEAVYHLYVITTDDRKGIMDRFSKENVHLGIHYEYPVHKNPGYMEHVRIPAGKLSVTDKLAATVVSLPIYPEFPPEDARKIAEFLKA